MQKNNPKQRPPATLAEKMAALDRYEERNKRKRDEVAKGCAGVFIFAGLAMLAGSFLLFALLFLAASN